jgi:hypothetical protein
MSPAIRPGEPIEMSPDRNVRGGRAVLFRGSGDFDILHRYLFKLPFLPYFVHRGDAADARAGVARSDRILGVARVADRRLERRDYWDGMAAVAAAAVRAAKRRLTTKARERRP